MLHLVFPTDVYFLYRIIGANVLELYVDVRENGPHVL